MRSLLVFLVLFQLFFFNSCKNQGDKNQISPDLINNPASDSKQNGDKNQARIEFKKTLHDFGTVIQGAKVSYAFKFTNIGSSDLIISNCVPSCGCTVPDFPKKPIKPGDSDYITVTFDSKGRSGKFDKDVMVYTNTIPNSTQIFIIGSIVNK